MEKLNHVEILGVPFLKSTKNHFLENEIVPAIKSDEKRFIITANPEIVMHAYNDESYKTIMNQADYVIADGIGIIIASKIKKNPLPERIPGFELMNDLLIFANKEKLKVYFFGGKEKVLNHSVENIRNKFSDLKVVGSHHGYVDLDDEEVINQVMDARPDIVLVALGCPKQEEWIDQNKDKLQKGILMGVGGSFDVWAGETRRAPEFWIKLNLEWLYRLIKQPSRMRRVLKLPQFIIHVLRGK
ncbi:glycosyltransferase [Halalkalibacillus sediminis]|uniref:N-acetylglucosaminyldiphosphoundecaprenol N-acetyl-beta-D-mannosaminyltransferase n=1 Tax=Halalkalibacillus sediminis TaxID=2018042 RepID=A0A2I0QUM3_9BACI|nr:WecB/TagA/CpsF family glycosyltransferase [Halalkalibacillus sediminis]PKR77790.1 glycosyltransferase [Halalkalibacillus sediminis]